MRLPRSIWVVPAIKLGGYEDGFPNVSVGTCTHASRAIDDPEAFRQTLFRGALLFRWMWLGWMILLAVTASEEFRLQGLAWASIGAVRAWTVWLSVTGRDWTKTTLWFDILLSVWLVCASGLVVEPQGVISGTESDYA